VAHLFAQLSIRSKIIAGFAAVLICTIGLGLFSTQRLDAVNGNAQDIKDHYLPGTRILGRLAQVSERVRRTAGHCCWRPPMRSARSMERPSRSRLRSTRGRGKTTSRSSHQVKNSA
jgi:hypothetical protein